MANLEHLSILEKGVNVWNLWREKNPDTLVDFVGADLAQKQLVGANLKAANLYRANLTKANLENADLTTADLQATELLRAHLRNANLFGTNLRSTNLRGADLNHTDLTAAHLRETILADIDLTSTIGLVSCHHSGPSIIDHRTLFKSQHLPLVFLRGCGLPEQLIRYLPSLLEHAVQFYSCFISYSQRDASFAHRLHDDLQSCGVRCWLDEKKLLPGDDIYQHIDQAIRLSDKVLLCCSESALGSWWVDSEVGTAFDKEQQFAKRTRSPIPRKCLGPFHRGTILTRWLS